MNPLDSGRQCNWHDLKDSKEAADRLWAQMVAYVPRQTVRWARSIELKRMFDGDEIGGSASTELYEGTEDVEPIYDSRVKQSINMSRQITETVVAKVTKEQVKPQLVVTQGSWETRRRAKKADRFAEGQMQEQQGVKFRDLWHMAEHGLRLAMSCVGTSAVKFYSDPRRGKVACEVHDTLNMFVDVTNSTHDEPTWLGIVTWYSVERLLNLLKDQIEEDESLEDKIRAAAEPPKDYLGLEYDDDEVERSAATGREVKRVKVVEAWQFAIGSEKGRYVRCINGQWLDDEEWEYEEPPFVFIGGTMRSTGFWSEPIIAQVASLICSVNDLHNGIDFQEALTPKRVRYYDPEVHNVESLQAEDDAVLIPVVGLAQGVKPPVDALPEPFHPQLLELLKWKMQTVYEMLRMSNWQATGNLSGDWSGVALRQLKQEFVEQLAPIHRGFVEGFIVGATRWIFRCAREASKSEATFKSVWRGEGFVQELDADVLGILDETPYQVDTYTVGEKKNTPEDRVQLFQELAEVGIVSGDALLGILQHYDTTGYTEDVDAQKEMIDQHIDRWRMAEPEDISDPKFYRGPHSAITPEPAFVQVNRAYMRAVADGVDDDRLIFFEMYLEALDKQIQEKQQRMADLAAQAGGTAQGVETVTGGGAPPQAA